MSCSRTRGESSYTGLISIDPPPDLELKPLTDEEMKHTIACYCDRCGIELRIHPLFPIVGGKSLEHACVAKPPVFFEAKIIETKPYDVPITSILSMDFSYGEK